MSQLEPVVRRYQRALHAPREAQRAILQARARFADRLHGVDGPAPSKWRFVVPALTLLVAGVIAALVWPEAPLGVTRRGHPEQPFDVISASASAEEAVDFSDGSAVLVRPSSQLRIVELTPHGASVVLEHGEAHVAVVHRAKTSWLFSAGPYRVHVVGTEFELRWSPEHGGLEVEMTDGLIEVDGPGLTRQRVTSRQKLVAVAEPASASLYLESQGEPRLAEVVDDAAETPTLPRARVRREAAPEKPVVLGASWRYLADQGDAVGAIKAAEQAGFGALARSMPRVDVLLLGETAKKANLPGRAREAWLAVRERFPATVSAAEAGLLLGHLAEEQHDVDGAIGWYTKVAREAPNAATAPEALGSWLEVLAHAERPADARRVATEYLRRFKNGPQASVAREVLGR